MGSIKHNFGGGPGLLVAVGLLLLAATARADGPSTNCAVQCRDRNDLAACLYRCRFGCAPQHLMLAGRESDLPTKLGEDCAAYCQTHARDFPGKYRRACMITCESWHACNASGDKILHRIKEDEKKKKQDDVLVLKLGTRCDECGKTDNFMEYMGCLIENQCI